MLSPNLSEGDKYALSNCRPDPFCSAATSLASCTGTNDRSQPSKSHCRSCGDGNSAVEPDVANVTIGCVSYGETHDQAYQANLAAADKVIKGLLRSGIAETQIESGSLELSENTFLENPEKNLTPLKSRKFKAHQSWKLRVSAGEAQKLIDIAVRAGANGLEDVGWEVADEESLEAKARSAAMEKARRNADELAKSAGAKTGPLLFASNISNGMIFALASNRALQTSSATVEVRANGSSTPAFSLRIFPEKVSKQATVRAVFAME